MFGGAMSSNGVTPELLSTHHPGAKTMHLKDSEKIKQTEAMKSLDFCLWVESKMVRKYSQEVSGR